jgi:hypothetical protein
VHDPSSSSACLSISLTPNIETILREKDSNMNMPNQGGTTEPLLSTYTEFAFTGKTQSAFNNKLPT